MTEQETLEMDETLEKVVYYCMDEAKQKLEQTGECVPIGVVVEGENLYVETQVGDTPEECRKQALNQIRTASSFASHYAFCYDGFLETDEGDLDAIVVECADREMENAFVIGLLYKENEGTYQFEEAPVFIDYTDTMFDLDTINAVDDGEQN